MSGKTRVWALTLVLCAIEIPLFLYLLPRGPALDTSFSVPWWSLAIAFFCAEVFVVYLEFRREAYHFSLSEVVIVFGLWFASPAALVLGHLVGSAIGLLGYRRQSPIKAFFNLAHFTLGTTIAVIVFGGLVPESNPISVGGWAAAFAATIAGALLSLALISLAISFSQTTNALKVLKEGLPTGLLFAGTNASLGLIAANLAWVEPIALWLLVPLLTGLFIAYRAYIRERQHHRNMQSLLQTTRIMQRSIAMGAAITNLLTESREMFAAGRAEVFLFDEEVSSAEHALLDGEKPIEWDKHVTLDPSKGVWARSVSEGNAVLVKAPIENPRLRAHYQQLGIKDCMVAPFKIGEDVFGFIRVCNRLGDVSTFDDEDLRLLETVVNHASVSLHNARLVSRLEESLEHLKEMNRLKDDFVASVSHELRTPLTSIQGYVKTLLRKDAAFEPDVRRSFLETVDRQSERLRVLIEDLLIVSRLEAQQVRAVNKPFELQELLTEIVDELEPRVVGRSIRVTAEKLPVVVGDKEKVRQIVSNLVENALKYTPEGTPIKISARAEGAGIEIDVEDRGSGIDPSVQDKIFDRFFQVDQSTTRPAGGAGLGLYICRRLAEIVGGRLWLASSSSSGSVFSLWIPSIAESSVEEPALQA